MQAWWCWSWGYAPKCGSGAISHRGLRAIFGAPAYNRTTISVPLAVYGKYRARRPLKDSGLSYVWLSAIPFHQHLVAVAGAAGIRNRSGQCNTGQGLGIMQALSGCGMPLILLTLANANTTDSR